MLSRKQFLMNLGMGIPATIAAVGMNSTDAAAEDVQPDPAKGFVSVLDYGAVGDGVTDCTKAIQAAVDTKKNVYFPAGQYLVKDQIVLTGAGQTLFSESENQSVGDASVAAILVKEDIGKAIFLAKGYMSAFKGITIAGPGKTSKTTGILFRKDFNTDDVDCKVAGCVIKVLGVGVRIEGRGLRLQTNSFASVRDVVQIDWPKEHLDGVGLQRLPYGMRGFFFFNNRVHTCSTFIVNEGEKSEHLWGLSLTGNLMDIGDALIRGSATYSLISDNVICHTRRTPLFFNKLIHSTTISNNVISGSDSTDMKQPAHGIWFQGECHDVTISGNVFANIRRSALAFGCDKQEHVTINGNIFNNTGIERPSGSAAIRFVKPASQFAITGNSFRPGSNGSKAIIMAPKDALKKVEMLGNVCEEGKEMLVETS